MSPCRMLNIFICGIHISQALVLKAPQSPVLLGDTLRIIWHSEPGDPPFFDLNALCGGVDPLPLVQASTNSSQADVTIDADKIHFMSNNSSVSCVLRALNVTDGAVLSTSPPFDVISIVLNATQPLTSTSLPPVPTSLPGTLPGLNFITVSYRTQ
ncbi:hypothetical protein FPV67DRAFT_299925 [Lyophyllum atratum]|nr:hypothetical protein FPV67DRAFT_299925 [Lyophyllum atratum]